MPELPEVQTVRETLKPLLIGRVIKDITVRYETVIHENVNHFKQKLISKRFEDILRYGKYLIFQLEDISFISHLRMEGKYYIRKHEHEFTKHEHVIFHLDNNTFLTYHDVRKFGTMVLADKGQELNHKAFKNVGEEINSLDLNHSKIVKKIKSSQRAIKSILLDQSVVSGLGNIYVDETLFLAKIHPETKGIELSKIKIMRIIKAAQAVIQEAIEMGGTTIRTYQSTIGVDGRFQNRLNVHTKESQPCPVCKTLIMKIKVNGRGTYFCKKCQKR